MKAGAELDMAMALGPMGYNKSTVALGDPNSSVPGKCTIRSKPDAPAEYDRWTIFEPSTNIAHAWEVVAKMREDHDHMFVVIELSDETYAGLLHYRELIIPSELTKADTAPLAICLAALRATEGKGL